MSDQHYESRRNRKPSRAGGTKYSGQARIRQNRRKRTNDLHRSLMQSVSVDGLRSGLEQVAFPRLQVPSLEGMQKKLAQLVPNEARKKNSSRRRPTGGAVAIRSASAADNRRRVTSRPMPAQSGEGMSRYTPVASRSRRVLSDNRLHREHRVSNANQSKMPPVLVRGRMTDMAVRRPKKSLPKRRFDISLDVPGAELQLPSLPMVRVGWRLVSGALVLMMIACLFLMWKSPAFQVNTVEAEGLQRLTIGDLNSVMNILGDSIFNIDPPAVEQALSQAFPELTGIAVKTGLPAQVVISVVERQPVLAWFQDNREVWVDLEGVAFVPRGNPGDLVRVEGHGTAPEAIAGVAIPVADALPAGTVYVPSGDVEAVNTNGEALAAQTARLPVNLVQAILTLGGEVPAETHLVYDAQYGLGWDDPQGWEVYFGLQTSGMGQKLVVYQGVVEYLNHQGLQPELVSVEFTHAPYYRMER